MGTDMKTEESNKKSLGVSIEAGSDPGMSAERAQRLSTASDASINSKAAKKKAYRRRSSRAVSISKRATSPSSDDSTTDDGESSSEDEQFTDLKTLSAQGDLPQEFWQVHKLVRYLKIGNQTATIIALCNMVDYDLKKEHVQLAVLDAGGLEVLSNLLETEDVKCRTGSLRIIKQITVHPEIRRSVTLMGGVELMIRILSDNNQQLQLLASETIYNLAKFRRARRSVRKHGGIPKLVDLLDVDIDRYENDFDVNSGDTDKEASDDSDLTLTLKVARGASYALWSLSKSSRNKQKIKKAGGLPLLAKLSKMRHTSILIPVIGTLQECAVEPSYRIGMQTEGMIADMVRNLQSDSATLRMLCARAIFRLAEEEDTRDLVRFNGGLDPLVEMLSDNTNQDDMELMAAVTGAIWKCATDSYENVERFEELDLVKLLVNILKDNTDALDDLQFNPQKMSVLTNAVGALAECAKTKSNIYSIREHRGLKPLIRLINTNGPDLLTNVSLALGRCAADGEALKYIRHLDGVRLLWSLLKNSSEKVQASAAWALSPCIKNAENSGDMVRSFVGGLELICGLLESSDDNVLAACCFAIANIARDKENLAVITDHGVIEKLAKLAETESDLLRSKLAEAIGNCCDWAGNRALFGQSGAVAPLVNYLTSSSVEVHRSTSVALYQLSKDPWNCVTMHQNGVVPHLLRLIGSEDEDVQEASADCLQNIRKLALACEKFRYQHMKA